MNRLIYIDTSEFVSANFDYSGSRFSTVVSRVEAGQIKLGLPSITKREISSQLEKALHVASQALGKVRNDARVLRNVKSDFTNSLFEQFDSPAYKQLLDSKLNNFLVQANAINLDFDNVNVAAVFDLYFSKKPPFGLGKKKNEFPDAFVLEILSAWAEEEQQEVYIASSDTDIEEGIKNYARLHYAGTLEQLLDKVAREFDNLIPSAEGAVQALEKEIEETICRKFEELGFVLDDQDGEVSEARALEASFVASLLHVEDLGNGSGAATFDLVTSIKFEADLTYDDMDTAIYDSEDKQYYVLNVVDETVDGFEVFQANLEVTFSLTAIDEREFTFSWGVQRDVRISSSASDHFSER